MSISKVKSYILRDGNMSDGLMVFKKNWGLIHVSLKFELDSALADFLQTDAMSVSFWFTKPYVLSQSLSIYRKV